MNEIRFHEDVIKWKHFPRYWPFVREIHRWRGALMFSLICVWINGWVNNGEAGDLRRYRANYDVILKYWRRECHNLQHITSAQYAHRSFNFLITYQQICMYGYSSIPPTHLYIHIHIYIYQEAPIGIIYRCCFPKQVKHHKRLFNFLIYGLKTLRKNTNGKELWKFNTFSISSLLSSIESTQSGFENQS